MGCAGRATQARNASEDVQQLMRRYRDTRDYTSLTSLAKILRAGMQRAEIERLLGPPDVCFLSFVCIYQSNRLTAAATTLSLVVEFETGNVAPPSKAEPDDRLARYSFKGVP